MTASLPGITGNIDNSSAIAVFPAFLRPWRSGILAYGSLVSSTCLGFPIDAIKTRIQAYGSSDGYVKCIKEVYSREGIRGFYRGMTIPVAFTSLTRSATVQLFIKIKPTMEGLIPETSSEDQRVFFNTPICFFSGVIASGIISIAACPFDLAKVASQVSIMAATQLKNQGKPIQNVESLSGFSVLKRLQKFNGNSAVFSGFRYHLLRDSAAGGVYYSSYESIKMLINYAINSDYHQASNTSIMVAGGVAGVLSGSIAFPFDRVKLVVQKNEIFTAFEREAGIKPEKSIAPRLDLLKRSSYNGLGASVVRYFFVNLLFFMFFETSMKYLT